MKKNVLLLIITLGILTQCNYSDLELPGTEGLYIQVFTDSSAFYFDEIKTMNQQVIPNDYQQIQEGRLLINLPIDKSQSSCGYIFQYKAVYDTLIFQYKSTLYYDKKTDAFLISISDLVIKKHTFKNAFITIDHWDETSKHKIANSIYAKIYY